MADEMRKGTAQLRIRWDGDVPGLAEHRISLAGFGNALANLLSALRRIATQMVTSAVENEQPRFGRFASIARQLDIEIVSIEHGSGGFNGLITFQESPEMLPIFGEIPERVAVELLDSIDEESKGNLRNSSVRRYLNSLPSGLHKQTYEFHLNGDVRKRVEIGDLKIGEIPTDLPYLVESEGSIIGVGFEPGRNEIKVKQDAGGIANLSSNAETVERALAMRHDKVRTLSVHTSKGTRVITLKLAADSRYKLDPETAKKHIFKRWENVLRQLAK